MLSAVTAACGSNNAGSGASGGAGAPIKISAILPLTGNGAAYGQTAKTGLEMGVKAVNDAGGINGRQVQLQIEDNQLQAALTAGMGVTALGQSFLHEGVRILRGDRWPALPVAEMTVVGEDGPAGELVRELSAFLADGMMGGSALSLAA